MLIPILSVLALMFTLPIKLKLVQLIIEGGTAIAVFIRCFVDKKGIEQELERRLHVEFPREVLATISVILSHLSFLWQCFIAQLFHEV